MTKTILELEDCKSDILDDYNIAFERADGNEEWNNGEWKCIKDFKKINLQGIINSDIF